MTKASSYVALFGKPPLGNLFQQKEQDSGTRKHLTLVGVSRSRRVCLPTFRISIRGSGALRQKQGNGSPHWTLFATFYLLPSLEMLTVSQEDRELVGSWFGFSITNSWVWVSSYFLGSLRVAPGNVHLSTAKKLSIHDCHT